jgi:hypothetical protein
MSDVPTNTIEGKPVRRVENWEMALHRFIAGRKAQPFDWRANNCCFFACDGIQAITGLDPAAESFRGVCHGALDAARLVRKHGGVEAIADAVCAKYGFEEVPITRAQRGDVVLLDVDRKYRPSGSPGAGLVTQAALGICTGLRAAFAGPAGVQFVAIMRCRRAWAIGRAV